MRRTVPGYVGRRVGGPVMAKPPSVGRYGRGSNVRSLMGGVRATTPAGSPRLRAYTRG